MAKYEIELMFDAGSGACLWGYNEVAKEELGYPIDHNQLPISTNTKMYLDYLIAWHNTSINWEDPGSAEAMWDWTEAMREEFINKSETIVRVLESELGSDFEIKILTKVFW